MDVHEDDVRVEVAALAHLGSHEAVFGQAHVLVPELGQQEADDGLVQSGSLRGFSVGWGFVGV